MQERFSLPKDEWVLTEKQKQLKEKIYQFLYQNESAKDFIKRAITENKISFLSRIFNELPITDLDSAQEFTQKYVEAIAQGIFKEHTIKNALEILNILLDCHPNSSTFGQLKEEMLALIQAIVGEDKKSVLKKLCGDPVQNERVTAVAAEIVAAVIMSISLRFLEQPTLRDNYSYLALGIHADGKVCTEPTFKSFDHDELIDFIAFPKIELAAQIAKYEAIYDFLKQETHPELKKLSRLLNLMILRHLNLLQIDGEQIITIDVVLNMKAAIEALIQDKMHSMQETIAGKSSAIITFFGNKKSTQLDNVDIKALAKLQQIANFLEKNIPFHANKKMLNQAKK